MADQPDRLERMKAAQTRVDALQAQGVAMNSQEARAAVNGLFTLIRSSSPEELKVFDEWKKDRPPASPTE